MVINAAVDYKNVTGPQNRKAVLLIKAYEQTGKEVDQPCGKMAKSGHLNAYFKYLPSTQNQVLEQHRFVVPENVTEMQLGLCGFNKSAGEQVFVENLSVCSKSEKRQFEQFVQDNKGRLEKPDCIELSPKTPIWHSIPVIPGQNLIVNAAIDYQNVKGNQTRKAVLLIKSYDQSGKEVDQPCGKMSKSGHLKAYFKYLPCTQNQVKELHAFTVPEGVTQIRLGLCGFSKSVSEHVFVKELSVKPKTDKTHPSKFVPPSAQASEISILGWPEYPTNGKPYVIGIMDEFTTGCFEQDLNLIQPRSDNWYALAEKYRPELFFIESAWKGNFGSWQYRVANYANKPGQEVAQICQYAKQKGVPTLFWNKEDPVHHEKFMCSAKLADHIFTTDANMIDSYRAKTGNHNVYALPFAAQPALHKPASLAGRKPLSCFAGSWYGNRHAERGEAMRWLLQAANKHGLDIYDRNYGTGIFPFPEEYQAGIKGSLPYKELCNEYSRYRVFLNVNSVTDSPTMFSRRVFELMACGTPVVSTYAKGIDNLFDSDAVWMVHSQEEADEAIHTLMTDDAEWRRRSLAGIREVFAKHTYAHRLNDIFERLGIESRIPTEPAILLVAEAFSKADLEALNHFAKKQHYRQFRLGIECPQGGSAMADSLSDNIVLLQPGEKATWVTEQLADYPIAGWLTPSSQYGEHYLRDLANASLYEPRASGWAKSLNQDLFDYGQQAALCGILWKAAEFVGHYIKAKPDATIEQPDLYVADSDQFQYGGIVQQQVVGAKP
ncbi:CgeB family protein [Marinobacterium aestuariivivens]|uniref:Glycosyltransferase n=1 Tax=Marinobacterium aestuariivivens TaxID=1698799 RepID=A0ABW1ZUV6_9GAMM